ncbi:MAG: hypothetical protein HYS06_12990 [Methylocystis sp.]|nr:hypothetical protein [Methylocystis sp.]MBI3275573.1 hypothetical protein [Methylocystis sp.]
MTDEEYRQFLAILTRRYVQPKIPHLRRRFAHHMMEEDEWSRHLTQAERGARVLRFIEDGCDDDPYQTFTLDRLSGSVWETWSSLGFSNRIVEESGFLDAYEAHAGEILAGLRPEHLPEADKEVLRAMGSSDPDAELAELVFRARGRQQRMERMQKEAPIQRHLRTVEEQLDQSWREFDDLRKMKSKDSSAEIPKKSRRWFKGLGQIAQGAALSIANVGLAVGVFHFPVSPETQTWGALASVATGIGTVLNGVGDLINE